MGKLFDNIRTLVERDVDRWNKIVLDEDTLQGSMILRDVTRQQLWIEHTAIEHPEKMVLHYISIDDSIIIRRDDLPICKITTRWDREASQCHLVVHMSPEEPTEFAHNDLAKVVQYILEFFFSD